MLTLAKRVERKILRKRKKSSKVQVAVGPNDVVAMNI